MGISVTHLVVQSFRNKYDIRSLIFTMSLFLLGLFIRVSLDYSTKNFEQLKLEIQLGNASPNELLHLLTQRGQVTHFVEKIPSVNDIFIQTVSKN